MTTCWMAECDCARSRKEQQHSITAAWPACAVMAFRMTGIAPASTMGTMLALLTEMFAKALQPYSFTNALPAWAVMAFMMTGIAPAATMVP